MHMRFGGYVVKVLLRLSMVVAHILVVAFGASLAMKAAVGIGAWDAVSQAMSMLLPIKVGTFAILLNTSCVVAQLVMLHKNFDAARLVQVGVAILLGVFVNWVYYSIFADLVLSAYWIQMFTYLLGIVIIGWGVGMILAIDLVTFPLEALCLVIVDKTGWNFGRVRQGFDVGAIVFVLIVSFAFNLPLVVREGTIIGMILFGPMVGWFMKMFKPTLKRLNLAD